VAHDGQGDQPASDAESDAWSPDARVRAAGARVRVQIVEYKLEEEEDIPPRIAR